MAWVRLRSAALAALPRAAPSAPRAAPARALQNAVSRTEIRAKSAEIGHIALGQGARTGPSTALNRALNRVTSTGLIASTGLSATTRRGSSTSTVGGVSVASHRDFLRVRIDGAGGSAASTHYDFHWFWLRHLCPETPYSRHPATGERTLDAAEVPLDIQPQGVRVLGAAEGATEPTVEIAWGPVPHAHASRYPVAWLLRHAYGKDHVEVAPPLSDPSTITLDFGRYATDAAGRPPAAYFDEVRLRMRRHGAVVVRGRGFDTEAIISDLLPEGASVVETHFGRIEDLRTDNSTNKNTDQLGYTDAPVNLHTDQPFIAHPPGMQMLQCIRAADTGGENLLVDARQAAIYLRELDPEAFRVLTTTKIRFHRQQKAFESIQERPLIELDAQGRFQQVRHSYFTMAPFHRPFGEMRAFYRAYNAFAAVIHDPRNQLFLPLTPGDFVLYDNHRMLHARTGFKGARHMRGVYFNHADVWRKLDTSAGTAAPEPAGADLWRA